MNDVVSGWPRSRMLVLVALTRRHRVDEAVLLAGSEYTVADLSDPRLLPTRDDEAVLVRNLVRALGGALGPAVEAGQDFHVGAVSAWGQAMRTSPTLGHALALSLDLTAAADTLVHLRAVPDDEVTHLVFDADHLPADTRAFQSVWMMVTTAIINRELLGRPTPVDSVRVRCAKPPDAPLVDDFWGVEVQWDARVTSIGVPLAVLDAPLPSADPRAHAEALRECELLFTDDVAVRARAALARDPQSRPADTAAALGLSERTLRRRLAEAGTAHRELAAEARLARAADLLTAGLPRSEVAARLGFTDTSAFSHAFKRWTGVTPTAWLRSRHRPSEVEGPGD
ncbi:Transcriptional regulator, AraC family [Actinokineospora spheciospongiae]|uniref:Transcriptional regulator, AraC family n=1 Tax=Actinokineospora spheciospongiae TaxID=909613 RepID=W7IWI3_9PSEU|nr:AraC family transcriptional regulator ligand-binding domain-containing protein [Actinokineospora spheciospongiae]EWC61172.1 Transcriptional regulator, AraC family [Actinokineospora spheciospongiae]